MDDHNFPPAVPDPAAPPAALRHVAFARDALLAALIVTASPTLAQLEVLVSLDEECRVRGAGQDPDALSRLIAARRREAERFERMCDELQRERED